MDIKPKGPVSIFINRMPGLTRIAVMREDNALGLVYRFDGDHGFPGEVYLGKVTKVLPGIQAAFLDIGDGAQAFLDKKDLPPSMMPSKDTTIESVLKEGRTMLVQIKKSAYRDKVARVGAETSLVGFSLILTALSPGIRFSRRYKGDRAQKDYSFLTEDYGHDHGWIIRSSGEKTDMAAIRAEAKDLMAKWEKAFAAAERGVPRQIGSDCPITSCIQQWARDSIRSIFFDDESLYDHHKSHLQLVFPSLSPAVKLHLDDTPLFDTYNLEAVVQTTLSPRVWLKSGGFVDFHQTEALTAVDVNSGKRIKGKSGVSAVTITNLEAAPAICRQIRVRDISGLIVIDFINALEPGWRKNLDRALAEHTREDSAAVDLLPVNRFGLAQMTRSRMGPDIAAFLSRRCSLCGGTGRIPTVAALAVDVQKQLLRDGPGFQGETVRILCDPELAGYLKKNRIVLFEAILFRFELGLEIESQSKLGPRTFRLEL